MKTVHNRKKNHGENSQEGVMGSSRVRLKIKTTSQQMRIQEP